MQRWWYSDDKSNVKDKVQREKKRNGRQEESNFKEWTFKVFVNTDLNLHEKVAVTGSCDELGNWDPDHCVLLSDDGSNTWTLKLNVPSKIEINYRYFIASIDPSNSSNVHVRKWETHLKARCIPAEETLTSDNNLETFGVVDGIEKVDKGWLTNETILQFKFFNNPFMLKERIKNRLLYVKMTPMNLRINAESSNLNAIMDESLSNDTRENATDTPAYAFTEVATINGDEYMYTKQEQFGRAYKNDDVLTFHVTVTEPENIAYLIDLYTYSKKSMLDHDPPYHLGYHYLLPNMLRKSEGCLELPITCSSKHRPLGMMRVEYVKITPINDPKCDLSITYERHWNEKHKGLDVGHRGAGTSFKSSSGNTIRENTIASLKKAASSGAKFVEFDVQLSKDLHPVIYHDFHVYVSLKKKGTFDANDLLELPMKELTLEQLKNLKVYHTVEGRSREPKFFDEDLAEHQPFPELAEALEMIDEDVGFNIEIKSAQELEDGTLESTSSSIDKNLYVDCILEVVLAKAGKRRIVFSSFDPDICIMLRNKQNVYPTMFLTLGKTTRYKQYRFPLCNTIQNAVKFSVANELLGIVAHSEDLLRDISQVNLVKDHGLAIFCWGDDNNCKDNIKFLKDKGLHAIIYDKVDVLIDKEVYYVGTESKTESDILAQIGIEHPFTPSTSVKLAG
ncbi:glycerophosphocholine phosphodiesterase GPCPD1-like [Chironomus tepperi]|uniref:glycerophosphocholine phosphodiesterase GPCPD1-like n=1 Tax=Chironomus tepperi TaxID=113505 RepID=UPI00391FA3E0